MGVKILGLGHYSRTGKDTLAKAISDAAGSVVDVDVGRCSFAYALKDIAYRLYGWAGVHRGEWYETKDGEKARNLTIPAIGMTPVELWVKLGTDAIRNCVFDDTWINLLFSDSAFSRSGGGVVITDVRFSNEVRAIRARGGKLVKVVRPGYAPRDTDADRDLLGYDGWDLIVGASGEMDELREWGWRLAGWFADKSRFPVQSDADREFAKSVEAEAIRVAAE